MVFSAILSSSPHIHIPKSRPIVQRTIRCASSSSSATVSNHFDLKTYWATLIGEINKKLDDAIPVKYPEQIYETMRYSVLANRLVAYPTACALEMVHAASLIHDGLPCMDDDPSRRGQPSNHTVFGVDMAILAGDALFPLGFQHIVSHTPSDLVPEARVLRVIAEIARAVGSTGMAAGQFVDLGGVGQTLGNLSREKKFGEMAECSAVCGGLLAGAADDEIQRLRRYGRAVGVLYQVVNDLLEAKSNENKERKRKSYVGKYGVEKAMEVAEDLRSQAKRELEGFEKYGENVLPLYSFVDYAANRDFIVGDQV
uniref:Geranylgeranyl pyrophosphate n=1 Tax=Nothapodytes nimmoniana TaxID=159386 RepID=A0A0N6YJG4_NOTNI|nr:geranylgeranyl pyrophosphate [Nothapodytes nimmoniana]